MVTAPHYLASQAGLDVLRDGGNACEAAVAVAATLSVVYPHMTGIGGDSFWLVREPDGRIHGVDACGRAAGLATLDFYRGQDVIWPRGSWAANTMAGTISGWEMMLEGGSLPLDRLLRDAIHFAEAGVPVTKGGAKVFAEKGGELSVQFGGWGSIYMPGFRAPREGDMMFQPQLGQTLRRLTAEGLDSFYRGALAEELADTLEAVESPLRLDDFHAHRATRVDPLHLRLGKTDLYNMPPPTQGIAALLILAIAHRLPVTFVDAYEHVHGLVEATKRAFRYRDAHVGDPAWMTVDPQALLNDPDAIDAMAAEIDMKKALPWPEPSQAGDTCWFAAADSEGRVVSAIQSVYHEFGSGVTLYDHGVTWQNRGSSFRLAEDGWNALRPGRKPFHTLNPAMACFEDGRVMAYGTMGGEGQPQTQAAVFSRYARFGMNVQEAISRPRWLLGRTWGEDTTTLKIERDFRTDTIDRLVKADHSVETVEPLHQSMGHAGALIRHPDGGFEGATDPRSDGQVAAW